MLCSKRLSCGLLLLVTAFPSLAADPLQQTAGRRRPVAAVQSAEGAKLYVVNQGSGSLSQIDLEGRQVTGEFRLGESLSDIARLESTGMLLVSDRGRHELLVVEPSGLEMEVIQRLPVARHPVGVAVSPDETEVAVAGLWSHRVTFLAPATSRADEEDAADEQMLQVTATVQLPFAPRHLLFVDETRRLIVLDAFGGQVALVDPAAGELLSVRELPAQNMRGVTLNRDGTHLLIAHQVLSRLARTDFDDIHWGNLLRNVVTEIPLTMLLDPQADLLVGAREVQLGVVGEGAADPAGLVLLPALDGWMVALSGTSEVAIQTRGGGGRVDVGTRPTSIVWDDQRQLACVLCTLDDEVALVDPVSQKVVDSVSLGPQPAPSPADRGERLFVDGRRSHDGWLSCQSCHPDGHTTGGLADTKSDGTFGTPKRILSLLGTRDSNPWAWNGQFRELHEQVASSFESSLQGEHLPAAEISDVVAYLHMHAPPPAVDAGEWTPEEQVQIQAGRGLFNELRCGRCHVPPLTYTIDLTFDVGLADEENLRKFNPPSLRGISQRRRFFHDGRAETLEAVFDDYGHQLPESLSEEQLAALTRYLRSL